MNFKANESIRKLTGSYYTPKWIAEFVARWVSQYGVNNILEPSCGDGVFFEAITQLKRPNSVHLVGFDIDAEAIANASKRVATDDFDICLTCGDYLEWAISNYTSPNPKKFNAVVGNPPFIRYQYLEKQQQQNAQTLFSLMGMKFTKHTNAWIPFVVSAIEFLMPGGIIGMVIPSELLHVLYAKGLRDFLLKKCSTILLIDPEDLWFEDTLQGAMLLMAQRKQADEEKSRLAIMRTKGQDFAKGNPSELFEKADYIDGEKLKGKWTYALLTKQEFEAYTRISHSASVFTFSKLANVDVGIVTGANKYFLVRDDVVEKYGMHRLAHPMFGRSEHCPGIVYDAAQHTQNARNGHPTNFLYFENEDDGKEYEDYIRLGEEQEIHLRYKCRIRKPWYRVPSVFATSVSMLKRSNGMPRLILNRLGAYTTDTAYRITPNSDISSELLVFSFLNTLTALSAELEGRFYGGGVLELVPSEIERLLVPYCEDIIPDIDELNVSVQRTSRDELLRIQDNRIFCNIPDINIEDIDYLREAFYRLQLRRQRIADFGDDE